MREDGANSKSGEHAARRPLALVGQAAVAGMRVGVPAGLLVAVVDYAATLAGGFEGSRLALAAYSGSTLSLAGAALGGLWGAWGALCRPFIRRLRSGALRPWLLGAGIAMPMAAFMAWLPTQWLDEHWQGLSPSGRLVAGGVCATLAIVGLLGAGAVERWWPDEGELLRSTKGRRVSLSLCPLLAGGAYWVDREILVGLYPGFHVGLTALVAGALTAVVVFGAEAYRHVLARLPGFRRTNALTLSAVALAAAVLVALEVGQPDVFGPSRSTVFSKLVLYGRKATDFDGDGFSAFFGGRDCNGFNAAVAPGNVDVPGNDLDEDCSGEPLRWTRPPEVGGYPVPGLQGYNVILITVDALRADHLGTYGYSRNTSPALDQLAARSLVFMRAYAPSSKTYDSVPTLLSGVYPSNTVRDYRARPRTRWKGTGSYAYLLGSDTRLLAERLSAEGYTTAGFLAVSLLERLGLTRSLDHYVYTHDQTDEALKFLDTNPSQPFFMWLHYYGPHSPYIDSPEHHFGDEAIDHYDSEIAQEDEKIGRLLAALKKRELSPRTLIVVTADHGEEFGDHGGQKHGLRLYRELIHVPLIVWVPGLSPRRVDTPVGLVDVLPTVCELVMPAGSPCTALDGSSLLNAAAGLRADERGAYSELFRRGNLTLARSLFTAEWHLIENLQRDRVELYHVQEDPLEQHNVARQHPNVVSQLTDQLAARPLERARRVFDRFAHSGDAQRLLVDLPTLQPKAMFRQGLKLLTPHLTPAMIPELERLRRRAGTSKGVRRQLATMVKRARTSPVR